MNKTRTGIMSFAIVLIICISMCCTAYADSAKMTWAYPQPGDDMTYHWETEKNVGEVDFSDIAMYLSFDVADSGKQHLIKAGWLPELGEDAADGIFNMDQSSANNTFIFRFPPCDTRIGRPSYPDLPP